MLDAGQVDLERRARPDLAVHADVPAGLLDDAVDSGQPQPGPLARPLGGEERLEDLSPSPPCVIPQPVSVTPAGRAARRWRPGGMRRTLVQFDVPVSIVSLPPSAWRPGR